MSRSPAVILYSEQGRNLRSDAFDVLRTSNPAALFDDYHKYGINPNRWGTDVVTGGTVTHVPLQSAANIAATATSGSRARLRSRTFFRYQSGRGQAIRQSVYSSDAGVANQRRRWGYFDESNGFFWELDGTTFQVVRRTNTSGTPTDTAITQANFNYDKLDGTGASGFTLDVAKGNIYEIDFSWLGVGRVRWFVNGILAHEETYSNTLAVPYMQTAVLPIQYEVVNTGAAAIGSITNVCSTVYSDGGNIVPAYAFGARNTVDIAVGTTETLLMAIRPKATLNSITNRVVILPNLLVGETDGARASIRVVQGATVTGGTWVSADTESGVEYNITGTGFSGGEHIVQGFMPAAQDTVQLNLQPFYEPLERALRLGPFGSVDDTVVILATNEKTGTTDVRSSLTWEEIR